MPRQRREQYLTSSQQDAHLRRHLKGRLQTAQILAGRFGLACMEEIPDIVQRLYNIALTVKFDHTDLYKALIITGSPADLPGAEAPHRRGHIPLI
jgi:hypothetical protein